MYAWCVCFACAMDPTEARFVEAFFTGEALERSMVALCLGAKHAVDPIASVILQVCSWCGPGAQGAG